MRRKILITRPAENARATEAAVKALGLDVFIEPLMEIEPLRFQISDDTKTLIFTSGGAVRVAAKAIENKQQTVYCVAEKTASLAENLGWKNVKFGTGGVGELNAMLIGEDVPLPAVHLSAEDIAGEVELTGAQIDRVVCYKSSSADKLSDDLVSLIKDGEVAAVLLYSPRSAEIFCDLAAAAGLRDSLKATKALCLSDSVLKSVTNFPWQAAMAANGPNEKAMLELLAEHVKD